jgi:hypothetical protein
MPSKSFMVSRIRIYLPDALDNGERYDFMLSLPANESHGQMRDRLRQQIEEYFSYHTQAREPVA